LRSAAVTLYVPVRNRAISTKAALAHCLRSSETMKAGHDRAKMIETPMLTVAHTSELAASVPLAMP
jgi:hypothetical protein